MSGGRCTFGLNRRDIIDALAGTAEWSALAKSCALRLHRCAEREERLFSPSCVALTRGERAGSHQATLRLALVQRCECGKSEIPRVAGSDAHFRVDRTGGLVGSW